METIIVLPKNKKQLSLLKSFLKEMQIKFKSEKSMRLKLPAQFKKNWREVLEKLQKEESKYTNSEDKWRSVIDQLAEKAKKDLETEKKSGKK